MYKNREYVEEIKRKYPPGTPIVLDQMGDDPHSIPPGSKGQVKVVDDIGTVHCVFEDGSRMGLIIGEDTFHIDDDLEKEPRNITLHIQYKEPIGLKGFIVTKDKITFSSIEELNKYINGEPAYNMLDDSVRKTANEILLYAEDEKGEVVWGVRLDDKAIQRPNQYYEPDLDLNGTAEELFIQARNGYIDSIDALGKLQEILSNPVENKLGKAKYVGILKEIAETVGKEEQVFAQMKKDILDGVNPEEVVLREGLTLEVFKYRNDIVMSIQEITDQAYSTGGTVMPVEKFLSLSAKEISSTVNEVYFYNMVEESRHIEPVQDDKMWKPKQEREPRQHKDDFEMDR